MEDYSVVVITNQDARSPIDKQPWQGAVLILTNVFGFFLSAMYIRRLSAAIQQYFEKQL